MKKLMALVLALTSVLGLVGCSQAEQEDTVVTATDNVSVIAPTETESQFEPVSVIIPTCKSIEAEIADDFIDPSTVTVLGGEWSYTDDSDRFVALVSVKYINKFDEYETAEYVVLGVFGGEAHTNHCLNQHSPYTRENVLQEFGAIDSQRFTLE